MCVSTADFAQQMHCGFTDKTCGVMPNMSVHTSNTFVRHDCFFCGQQIFLEQSLSAAAFLWQWSWQILVIQHCVGCCKAAISALTKTCILKPWNALRSNLAVAQCWGPVQVSQWSSVGAGTFGSLWRCPSFFCCNPCMPSVLQGGICPK